MFSVDVHAVKVTANQHDILITANGWFEHKMSKSYSIKKIVQIIKN